MSLKWNKIVEISMINLRQIKMSRWKAFRKVSIFFLPWSLGNPRLYNPTKLNSTLCWSAVRKDIQIFLFSYIWDSQNICPIMILMCGMKLLINLKWFWSPDSLDLLCSCSICEEKVFFTSLHHFLHECVWVSLLLTLAPQSSW